MISSFPVLGGNLDWGDWLRGLWAAVITGGSSAVLSSVGLVVMDPKDFSVGEHKLWAMAAGLFAWNGFLGMLSFLRQKPAPDYKTVTTTIEKTEQLKNKPSVVVKSTVQETHTEPLPPTKES